MFFPKDVPAVFLAPLAGITDSAFRQICKGYGADYTVSEMISAKGLYYKDKKTENLLRFSESERPIGIQIFGSEPEIIAYAAEQITETVQPDFIDINMGCPMPKIVNNGDGRALLKDPKKIYAVVSAARKATPLPLSVKIRKGFYANEETAPENAKIIESAGANFITIHGRTREQMYSGFSDAETIAKTKQAVKIPVIANGDIFSAADAENLMKKTGCNGVMVARGALGNPFIFEEIKAALQNKPYQPPTAKQRLETAKRHIRLSCEEKGERIAVPEARKHLAWYIKGMRGAAKVKTKIFTAATLEQLEEIIQDFAEIQS